MSNPLKWAEDAAEKIVSQVEGSLARAYRDRAVAEAARLIADSRAAYDAAVQEVVQAASDVDAEWRRTDVRYMRLPMRRLAVALARLREVQHG